MMLEQRSLVSVTLLLFCLEVQYLTPSTSAEAMPGMRERPSKIIESKQGPIQGLLFDFISGDRDLLGKSVQIFRGIPFAAAPLNSLRFLPPVTAPRRSGVKKAYEFAPVCPQNFPDTSNRSRSLTKMSAARFEEIRMLKRHMRNQSEDCLYLNVYSPGVPGN